jgi:hypothetical protein
MVELLLMDEMWFQTIIVVVAAFFEKVNVRG